MFRFTIRDVLWLMVVVGLSVGWWVDHTAQKARELEAAKIHGKTLREFFGEVGALKKTNSAMEQQLTAFENKLATEPDGLIPNRP